MSLLQYVEKMDSECLESRKQILDMKAIKFDGRLSHSITQETLKPCDYILPRNSKLYFIEFSDFEKQFSNLNTVETDRNQHLPLKLEPNKHYKSLHPTTIDIIRNEVNQKIMETMHIFTIMEKKLVLKNAYNREKIFIISHCSDKKSNSKIMDRISRDLKRKVCYIIKRVVFLPHSRIEKKLIPSPKY